MSRTTGVPLTGAELQLYYEGLRALRSTKQSALADAPKFAMTAKLTEIDFGLPSIEALIGRFIQANLGTPQAFEAIETSVQAIADNLD